MVTPWDRRSVNWYSILRTQRYATAADHPSHMVWEREGSEYANKDYLEAGRQNWDEGHKRDGHCSVFTSMYKLDVENGYLTATDTYNGNYMGSWR